MGRGAARAADAALGIKQMGGIGIDGNPGALVDPQRAAGVLAHDQLHTRRGAQVHQGFCAQRLDQLDPGLYLAAAGRAQFQVLRTQSASG